VQKERLDPVAGHLIGGYLDAAIYSRRFLEDHGIPPTLMAKAHNMRAVVQATITEDSKYELSPDYAEFGRVAFTEIESGIKFLIRSAAAVQVENDKNPGQTALFDIPEPTNPGGVQLIVYRFTPTGMKLSVTRTVRPAGKRRLVALGTPTFVGLWPYSTTMEPQTPFDQDLSDPFSDVGDLGEEEEGDAG
jgi:hypothetical protein